jgi:hypothetical protein
MFLQQRDCDQRVAIVPTPRQSTGPYRSARLHGLRVPDDSIHAGRVDVQRIQPARGLRSVLYHVRQPEYFLVSPVCGMVGCGSRSHAQTPRPMVTSIEVRSKGLDAR